MNIVYFLQNAWSPAYAGRTWPRASWLKALARSRSGQRLSVLLGENFDACENCTPICGANPSSIVPADGSHIWSILERRKPSLVVACGQRAEDALLQIWSGPMLSVPHPANRVITNDLYEFASWVAQDCDRRMAIRQRRGSIHCHSLENDLLRCWVMGGPGKQDLDQMRRCDLALFISRCESMLHEKGLLLAELQRRRMKAEAAA